MPKTVIKKDKKVDVQTKTGKNYSYTFTTLAQIHEWLEENHLRYEAFIKNVEGNDYMFIQKLGLIKPDADPDKPSSYNAIGEPIQEAKIPSVQGLQDYGGVLTSCRRYSLLMAFGLACEDDDQKAANSVEEAREKWKQMHTPDPNKPATEKQIDAIRRLCARAGKTLQEMNQIVDGAKNQALASDAIKMLGDELNKGGV